jgi:hypothetical protein
LIDLIRLRGAFRDRGGQDGGQVGLVGLAKWAVRVWRVWRFAHILWLFCEVVGENLTTENKKYDFFAQLNDGEELVHI